MLVYRHRNKVTNEVFYVGIGTKKRSKDNINRNILWKNIVNKYGHYVEIIQDNLSLEEACELEEFLINLYGRRDLKTGVLANMTSGGEGSPGTIVSESTKQKLRVLNTGKKLSEEHKIKIGIANKGKGPTFVVRFKQKEKVSKKVIDLDTNTIYSSARETAKVFGLKSLNLTRQLNGYCKNKTNFKYYE